MKLVILDRDGTIIHDSDDYIKSPAEWKPIKGSLEAIARLNQSGYRVVVATNQSGIGRKLFDTRTLFAIQAACAPSETQAGCAGQVENPNSVSQRPLGSPFSSIARWMFSIALRNGDWREPGSSS